MIPLIAFFRARATLPIHRSDRFGLELIAVQ